MFVDFGVVKLAMFFNPSLQASICLANIGAGATRACEFFKQPSFGEVWGFAVYH